MVQSQDDVPVSAPPLRPPLANTSSPRDEEPAAEELRRIEEWQQARIERKLRGEYQSAVIRINELVNGNLSAPVNLASIRVEGAPNTRTSFLSSIFAPHLVPDSESTLESVLHNIRHISHTLNRTDIFASVQPSLTRSTGPLSKDNDVDLIIRCKEKGRFFLKTATELGNGEGSASATARIRNVFGGAETLEGNVSFGTKTRRSFQVRLEGPLSGDLETRGELSAYGLERDNQIWASSNETVRGVKAAVRTPSFVGMHEFASEAALRGIGDLSPRASLSIREAAGLTSKFSLSHSLVHDTRDDSWASTKGWFARLFQEFAGFGGDASFLKCEAETQFSRVLVKGTNISFAARAGLLYPLGGKPSLFSDRFQLGGPLSVRSFTINGLGPRDGADSIGGDMSWSAGVSIIGDFPKKPHWPLKTHIFCNAGRLNTFNPQKSVLNSVIDSLHTPSLSVGVGLIYQFHPVRVELNFGVPLMAARTDSTRRGFQLGIGMDFL